MLKKLSIFPGLEFNRLRTQFFEQAINVLKIIDERAIIFILLVLPSNWLYKLSNIIKNIAMFPQNINRYSEQCIQIDQKLFKGTQYIMSLFSCANKSKKKYQKFGIVEVFRANLPSKSTQLVEIQQINKYAEQLSKQNPNVNRIKQLAWKGIPQCIRPKIWRCLLKYGLLNGTQQILTKKRQQYSKFLQRYWKPEQFDQNQKKVYATIQGDVKRIGIQFNAVLKQEIIQNLLKRLLYVWHIRHPASGYVQGMCDLTNPFTIVFLSEYLPFNKEQMKFMGPITSLDKETLLAIEADIYWCMSKMLESVQSNYTQGFGGIHQAYSRVEQLLFKIDQQLFDHFVKQKVDLFTLAFRNISTMLLRCFNPMVAIRLFDTYISYHEQYPTLIIFLLIAILEKFAQRMLTSKFEDLMSFMQNLPTKNWQEADLQILIAQAYVYKQLFAQEKTDKK